MTGEKPDKTDPWIEKYKAEYTYCYLSPGDQSSYMGTLGQGGYPSASLIDPSGNVVWVGHPSSVTDDLVEKHIANATTGPIGIKAITASWPDGAKNVAAAVKKRNFVKAHAAAVKLGDADVLKYVEGSMSKFAAKVKALHAGGDFLGFSEAMKSAKQRVAPLAMTELNTLLASVKKDKVAKAVLSGQKKLAKLRVGISEIRKIKDVEKMEKAVNKLAAKLPDSIVSRSADSVLKQLQDLRGRLNRR